MQELRTVFKFCILHGTPSSKLADIASTVTTIIKQQALVRFDRAHFAAIGESAYEFEVVYWMLDPDYNKYMDTQQASNIAMVQAFEKRSDERRVGNACVSTWRSRWSPYL